MIPAAYIREWRNNVPWQDSDMVEQDLIICRALTEIYNNPYLSGNLAFRGGTALNKLYIHPQPRYSEDIDLVQINPVPIKETIVAIQKTLSFLGKSEVRQKANNNTIVFFKISSETMPEVILKMKVEINCREHFTVLGIQDVKFSLNSSWHKATCILKTYSVEELLGTKLRALYQRRKGRDLYDLHKAITLLNPDKALLIKCYREYMKNSVEKPPTRKQFLRNIEEKILDKEFLGDTKALLRPEEKYIPQEAWDLIKTELVEKI